MMERIIWTDFWDVEDFDECVENWDELTDDEKYEEARELNDTYLEDERINLDVELGEKIIAIGDLGLWDRRVTGYKEIGTNLADCLYSENDYCEWYVDGMKNLRSKQVHHDGTNYILYRVFKENLSDEQKENFLWKVYTGKANGKDITRYTRRLGDVIGKIYGWEEK